MHMKIITTLRRLPRRFVAVGALAVLAAGIAVPTALAAPAQPNGQCSGMTQSAILTCVKQFGDTQIANRLTALNTLSGKVSDAQQKGHIGSDLANQLTGDVTTNENGLNALKTQLDGETTIAAARTDVHNIYWQFRIYAVVLPRDYHTLWLGILTHADQRLRGLQDKISDAIAKAPASEQTQLNQLFSDFKAQLQEAESQIDAGQGQLATLTVNNYNNARSVYETALGDLRTDTKTAQRDIKQAISDVHQIAQILKSNQSSGSSSGSSAATPTATSAS